ncbi:MAG: porin family protein [Rickettsia endosymbiont of Argas persicus]
MKKLLLIAATSATILSSSVSSFADMMDNEWYLRVDAGAAMFNKEKDKVTGIKLKTNTAFTGDLGIGYYVAENFRADLTLGTVTGAKLKKSGSFTSGKFAGTNGTVSHKPTISRLLVTGYADLSNFEMFDVFVGAGIGATLLKEKIVYSGSVINNGTQVSLGELSSRVKNRTNLAYKVTLGTSAQVADCVKAEIAYAWIDDGKSKSKTTTFQGRKVQTGGMRYQSHNLTAGIRFDI